MAQCGMFAEKTTSFLNQFRIEADVVSEKFAEELKSDRKSARLLHQAKLKAMIQFHSESVTNFVL